MSDYKNLPLRPIDMGINLVNASDVLEGGKWVSLHNIEPLQEAILPTRPGRRVHLDTETGEPIHSIIRLSDESLLLGIGTNLYKDNTLIDSGYSGNPLTFVSGQDGLIFVGDLNQISIVDAGGNVFKWGVSAPTQRAAFSAVGVGNLDSSVAGASVYDWRYTYESTKTKTESNASPVADGIAVVQQQGAVQVFKSNDPQVDKINLYRRGGTLPDAWRLVTTVPNVTQIINDNLPDEQLVLFDVLLDTNFPPFSSEDSSGNALFEVPLPYIWGPFLGKVIFATGDPNHPNRIYWTNFDSFGASDVNNFEPVTGTIEPLMNGWMFGSLPFVASRDAVYAVDFGNAGDPTFSVRRTPVGRGISGHWCFAVGPLVYILSKDGIYETDCQSPNVQSITEENLRPIFLGNRIEGQGIPDNTESIVPLVSDEILGPVDFEQDDKLRLVYANHELHFFYQDTDGLPHHLIYHTGYKRWRTAGMGDNVSVETAFFDVNSTTPQLLLATNNGKVYVPDPALMDDDGIPIEVKAKTGDFMNSFGFAAFHNLLMETVPADPSGSPIDVSITPINGQFDNWGYRFTVQGQSQSGSRLGKPVKSRFSLVTTPTTSNVAQDRRAKFGLLFEWVGRATIRQLMLQYRIENENVRFWDSGDTTHGLSGWQHGKDLFLTLRGAASDGTYKLTRFVDGVAEEPYEFTPPSGFDKQKIYIPLKPTKGKLFRYRVTAPPDPTETIQDNLVASWRLEEGELEDREDSFGEHTLVVTGATNISTVPGVIGNAVQSPPSGATYLETPDVTDLHLNNTSWSISLWGRVDTDFATVGTRALLGKSLTAGTFHEYLVCYQRTSSSEAFWRVILGKGLPGGTEPDLRSTTVPEIGTFYHIVATYDNDSRIAKLFVNGVLEEALEDPGVFGGSSPLQLLASGGGLTGSGITVDAVHIWKGKALNSQEIAYMYNDGLGREVTAASIPSTDSGFGSGFEILAQECEVRVKQWDTGLGYQLVSPFGPGDTPGQEP